MNANDITNLLAERHKDDIFVPQCKNGPTHTADNLLILDAWAMRRMWVRDETIGYEIKVSRSDFKNDQKWGQYLAVCHEFYFVCPAGLITAPDLPDGIGLIWASKSGRLHTKVKSKTRKPDPKALQRLLSYVLICRSQIAHGGDIRTGGGKAIVDDESRAAEIRRLVAWSDERKQLATFVNDHVRRRFDDLDAQVSEMKQRCADADRLVEHLGAAGIRWDRDNSVWDVKLQIDRLTGHIPENLEWQLQRAAENIAAVQLAIKEIRKPRKLESA